MPNNVPTYYFDADVFISYIEETPGRVDVIEALLSDAENGRIEVITSTVTVAEVAYHEREKASGKLDPAVEIAIAGLWESPSPVKLVEFHRLIGEVARTLIRGAVARQWRLSGLDAVHLATAQYHEVEALFTYDGKLPRFSTEIGRRVEPPMLLQQVLPLLSPPPRATVEEGVGDGNAR